MSTSPDLQHGIKSFLEAPAPDFTTDAAETIARQIFGLECAARPLVSERDQNFRLMANDGVEWVKKLPIRLKILPFWICRPRRYCTLQK